MKKLHTLSEKLKGYSLLAGSIMASSLAQGQVRYTNIIPDKELGGFAPTSFPDLFTDTLDLNNDGVHDFLITLNIKEKDTVLGGFNFREQVIGLFNNNMNNSVAAYTPGYFQTFVSKYDVGDSIPQYSFFHGYRVANFAFKYSISVQYLWHDVPDKYVGLKFVIGGDKHYGWLRVGANTKDTIPNVILKSYAYEETPDKKIAVGDTGFPLGIYNLQKQHQFSLYPNPSNGHCVIRLDQPLSESAALSVKDALGREVYTANVSLTGNRRELPLDFTSFAPGMYYVTLKSEDAYFTAKWMKH